MIQPNDFIAQADKLITGSSEMDFRSAVSRAYYSLYHETFIHLNNTRKQELIGRISQELNKRKWRINWIRLNTLDPNYLKRLKLNWHEICKDILGNIDPLAGNDFNDFRDERNKADYDLNLTFNQTNSVATIKEIKKLIVRVPTL